MWKGTNTVLVWLLNAVGWRKIFDASSEKEVGLNDAFNSQFGRRGKLMVNWGEGKSCSAVK
jgi:1-acylglycerone phosphate reductase